MQKITFISLKNSSQNQEGRLGKQTVLIGPWVSLSNKPIFAKFEFVAVQSWTRKPSWFEQNRILTSLLQNSSLLVVNRKLEYYPEQQS